MLTLVVAQVASVIPTPARAPEIVMVSDRRSPAPRSQVEVTMRTPEGVIWSGMLWTSAFGTSSWRQSVQEPLPEQCGERWSAGDRTASVQLSGSRGGASASPTLTQVSASWSRAVDTGECGGTRTVELRQIVDLPAGRTVLLRGDGGLVVELHRR